MKTLKPSLVAAALAGLLAASSAPAFADHHEDEKKGDAKAGAKVEKKHKHGKKAAATEKAGAEKVHCLGVNACKGKSECGVDGKHGCAGQNACKGQGWITLAKKDCLKKKGTVVAEKAAHEPEKAGMPAATDKK